MEVEVLEGNAEVVRTMNGAQPGGIHSGTLAEPNSIEIGLELIAPEGLARIFLQVASPRLRWRSCSETGRGIVKRRPPAGSPMPPSTDDQFAQINGFELRYRLRGAPAGPVAIIGHGLLGSIEQLGDHEAAFDLLAEHLRILLFDARGHGQSDGPEDAGAYSWESLGQDMLAIADLAGSPRPIVGGASMSAASALWVGVERPEVPRALVIMAPPPLGPRALRAEDERQALQMLDMLATAVESFGLDQTVAMAKTLPGFAASAEEIESRADWLLSKNPRTVFHAIRGLFGAPAHEPADYAKIRAPMIVFAHDGDPLHPMRSAQLLAEHVPNCRLHTGPEPNYWQTHPEEFAHEVLAFLADVG